MVAAESALIACLLVYCSPLPAAKREQVLDCVWHKAASHGLTGPVGKSSTPASNTAGGNKAGAGEGGGVAPANPPPRMAAQQALISEFVSAQWLRLVIDPSLILPCQILTFSSSVPLLLDTSGMGVRWLRTMSHMWLSSSGGPPGEVGRPQSDLIPMPDHELEDDSPAVNHNGNAGRFHAMKAGCCEGSMRNVEAAMKMLKLAAEEGLVAILHDVSDISSLRQVPSQLLVSFSRRHVAADPLHEYSDRSINHDAASEHPDGLSSHVTLMHTHARARAHTHTHAHFFLAGDRHVT
jgi:hypothetical protein